MNVFWFRRDLRIEDNIGLYEALKGHSTLAIFIFDPEILEDLEKDDARVSFIHKRLLKLHKALNGRLRVYHGKPKEIWKEILKNYPVNAVFYNKDYEPYALQRDTEIKGFLASNNISCHGFKDQVIFEENEVLKADHTPYTVYTPFKNKWLSLFTTNAIKPAPSKDLLVNLAPTVYEMPSLKSLGFIAATIQVPEFTFEELEHYEALRDIPALNQTSHLSTHLRFGTISIRQAVKRAKEINQTFLNELIWREFFMQILYHFPKVVNQNFKAKYDQIPWRNNEADFKTWCAGETGYPMVDAGMRELNETGLMHNRLRMVTASFLVKHLLIDWRWGEAYFAKKLLDYDLSANNGNWQWAAGTGCDSAPYFRIFNPESQQKRFDPKLIYIRRWLKDFDELSYPMPMVDHKFARERCLITFKKGLEAI